MSKYIKLKYKYKIDDKYKKYFKIFLDMDLNRSDWAFKGSGIANYTKVWCIYSKLEEEGFNVETMKQLVIDHNNKKNAWTDPDYEPIKYKKRFVNPVDYECYLTIKDILNKD